MLKIGDRVKFLNDVGGGIVTGFQSKNVVMVENQDGFEIPSLISQLVKVEDSEEKKPKIHDYSKKTAPKPVVEAPKEPEYKGAIISGNDEPKFFLAFYPTDQNNPVGAEIEVHLINDSNFTLLYHFAHFDGSVYQTIDTGMLEPNTKTYLEGISQSDLGNLPRFVFRILPVSTSGKSLVGPFVTEMVVHGMKFFKESNYKKSSFFPGKAMVFSIVTDPLTDEIDKLTKQDFKAVVNEKDKQNRPQEPKPIQKRTPEIVEVDLHIEELIDSTVGLSNHEILQIQLDRFQSEMKLAIETGVKRAVFIHGVGNGVLKQEIHKKLKSTYAKYYFQDASFQEYGYGATMVILKRK